jgi:hypothetical protein
MTPSRQLTTLLLTGTYGRFLMALHPITQRMNLSLGMSNNAFTLFHQRTTFSEARTGPTSGLKMVFSA